MTGSIAQHVTWVCRGLLCWLMCLAVPAWGDQAIQESEDAGELGSTDAGYALIDTLALETKFLNALTNRKRAFSMSPHRANYILPLSYYANPGDPNYNHVEIKFQFSFMTMLWPQIFRDNGYLSFAYTNQSYWQAYNQRISSPFRETNHEPEIMLTWLTDFPVWGLRNRALTLGLAHQSNGETVPNSRSWNRVYLDFILQRKNVYLDFQTWLRIPEERKTDPMQAEGDDNPDIETYLGHLQLSAYYKWQRRSLRLKWRNNLRFDRNKGALQVDYNFPLQGKLQGYVQLFTGYGESLIDYNRATTRIGLGIMLTSWL